MNIPKREHLEVARQEQVRHSTDLECTFTPFGGTRTVQPAKTVERLHSWQRTKAAKINKLREKRSQEEVKECTFHPQASSQTPLKINQFNVSFVPEKSQYKALHQARQALREGKKDLGTHEYAHAKQELRALLYADV